MRAMAGQKRQKESLLGKGIGKTREAFDYSGGYYYWMSKAFDLFLAGILWLVGSIPIVTFGASSAALYTVIRKCIRSDEAKVTETFFDAYKKNLKMGILHALLTIGIMTLMLWNFGIVRAKLQGDLRIGLMTIYLIAAALVLMTARYVFPLISRFDMPFGWYTKSALYSMVRFLPRSLLLGAAWLLAYYVIYRYFMTILILPALVALLTSKMTEPALKKLGG